MIGIGASGHALVHPGLAQEVAVGSAAVLAAAVTVEDGTLGGAAGAEGLLEGVGNEPGAQALCECPADDFPRAEIDDHG